MNVRSMPRLEPLLRGGWSPTDAPPVRVVILCHSAKSSERVTNALRGAAGVELVGVASSGAEADRLVRNLLPDVVLMDLRASGAGVIDATRRVRDASPTTRVTILTTGTGHDELYRALRAGASGSINRNSGAAELSTALRAVAHGHCVIPAHLAGGVLHDLESSATVTVSETEREILAGLASGDTHRVIAQRLHLSDDGMSRRLEDIYSKLHFTDRVAVRSQGA